MYSTKSCEGHIRLIKADFLQQNTSCQCNPVAGWLAYLHNALHKHYCTFKSGIFSWSFSLKECIFRINSQHEFWKISSTYKDTNTLNSSALQCAALIANFLLQSKLLTFSYYGNRENSIWFCCLLLLCMLFLHY